MTLRVGTSTRSVSSCLPPPRSRSQTQSSPKGWRMALLALVLARHGVNRFRPRALPCGASSASATSLERPKARRLRVKRKRRYRRPRTASRSGPSHGKRPAARRPGRGLPAQPRQRYEKRLRYRQTNLRRVPRARHAKTHPRSHLPCKRCRSQPHQNVATRRHNPLRRKLHGHRHHSVTQHRRNHSVRPASRHPRNATPRLSRLPRQPGSRRVLTRGVPRPRSRLPHLRRLSSPRLQAHTRLRRAHKTPLVNQRVTHSRPGPKTRRLARAWRAAPPCRRAQNRVPSARNAVAYSWLRSFPLLHLHRNLYV